MFNKMNQSNLKKGKSRKGKGAWKKQVFQCECGKNYWNYPALYLHFKRVHKMKISTRVNDQPCYVKEGEKTKTYTYLFSESKSRNDTDAHDNVSQNNSIDNIFQNFKCQNEATFEQHWIYACVLEELKKYLLEIKTFTVSSEFSQQDFLKTIPVLFNDFVVSKMGWLRDTNTYPETCQFLLELSRWLKSEKYSDITLEPMEC